MNEFTMNELYIGMQESFKTIITEEMHDSFARITGDVNPIHCSREFATHGGGYRDRLVYGMLTASFYSTLIGVYLPGKYGLFQECHVNFNYPVYVGDELTIVGEISGIHMVFRRITVKAFIKNQEDKKVCKATLIAGIREVVDYK